MFSRRRACGVKLLNGCLTSEIRDGAHVVNKAVHLAIGVTLAGNKDVLGIWLGQAEGAKLWLQIVTELKNRGVKDVFIACVDGLKGFPEAIENVFPQAHVQLCIVHMVRHSLNFVGYKERKEVASSLAKIYRSATRDEAELRRSEFAAEVGREVPDDQPIVATQLGTPRAVSYLTGRDTSSHLHHQCRQERQHEPAGDHQESRLVPHR